MLRTTTSNTALHFAVRYGRLAVVRYLVEQGADIDATTNSGQTAKDWAAQEGHTEIVAYLSSQGG